MTRTQPNWRDTTWSSGSDGPTPVTSSVDPPPISSTRNGPSSGSSSATAPARESRPSSVPSRTSALRPVIRSAGSRKSIPFDASRTAEVATSRPRTTPDRSITSRYSDKTAVVRSMASAESLPEASTPSPRRVMRITRSSGWASAAATSSRVELVPQSMAATGPAGSIRPCYHDRRPLDQLLSGTLGHSRRRVQTDASGRPLPHRVVAAGEPPGQMGVETFDPPSGPTNTTGRNRSPMVGTDKCVALGGVAGMGVGHFVRRHLGFGLAHPTGGFEATDRLSQTRIDQPEARPAWASRRTGTERSR